MSKESIGITNTPPRKLWLWHRNHCQVKEVDAYATWDTRMWWIPSFESTLEYGKHLFPSELDALNAAIADLQARKERLEHCLYKIIRRAGKYSA